MARAKTKAADIDLKVPQSDAEAEQMIAKVGAVQRDRLEAQTRHDAQVAALETAHAETVRASQTVEDTLVKGLSVWASAHRERLTAGGKTKTVQMASGIILWREGRYSVKHGKLKIEDVVAAVRERSLAVSLQMSDAKKEGRKDEYSALRDELGTLNGFLRAKVEIDKGAMLAARTIAEKVPGVSVSRASEEFAVEPTASQIREVA
ncbi:host-nuclease inhibitor Gam family protein [Methylobacterium sp. Leaf85]|uniref:host-nuclease inhibitor Gam family protein n=1 Tax=Methylobacterium sp. Leaf85 TaxID=1736241 RepID=UPI0007013272|nr:host-nuclease inhibitor Gam family protein [Methylobacterium sp. Leaf85]KQO53100.1 hypothetical protein ASF08_19440 [Methylobacterium sp. Leaf85]